MDRGGGIDLCLIRRRCPFLLLIHKVRADLLIPAKVDEYYKILFSDN